MGTATVTRLPHWSQDVRRYRIEGGTIAANWAATLRSGETAICEITVVDEKYTSGTNTGRTIVTCYGGSVWPSAWPLLFAAIETGGFRILSPGIALLTLADLEAEEPVVLPHKPPAILTPTRRPPQKIVRVRHNQGETK
jgi:hypothetical protein